MADEIRSDYVLTHEQLTRHSKINAGPGAGKTHFLVENVKNIVTTHPFIVKSRIRKVLCITYTNAAVDEIKRRLDQFNDYVEAYTIHQFIIQHIIQPFQQELIGLMKSDFGIDVTSKGNISSQIEGLGIFHGVNKDDIYEYIRQTDPDAQIEYSKQSMGSTEVNNDVFMDSIRDKKSPQMQLKTSVKIAENHKKPIKQYMWSVIRKLTHNEILYFGYRILDHNPIALYTLRVRFPFIFVDEFQDTNPLQTLLIKLIGKKSTILGIVGDIAQSIYSFQGAKPSDFDKFAIEGNRELSEYVIRGNRRSTKNIVNFCNFLRQSDNTVVQESIRPYDTKKAKELSEAKKIHFLIGDSPKVQEKLRNILNDEGVVLTRAWAMAFNYIEDIEPAQIESLKKIYNSYYASPIQLRDEIAEHHNVTWVKAFSFIFNLWEGYKKGAFIDILQAIKIYISIDARKITPQILVQIRQISHEIFNGIDNQSKTCEIIETFNTTIQQSDFSELVTSILGTEFKIPLFDDFESEKEQKLQAEVMNLTWDTSHKLFTNVFSKNSKYMTVHQAKGLEWDKVIVSVTPNRFDKTDITTVYTNPRILEETSAEEFARMYYVACSRAREELYIHMREKCEGSIIKNSLDSFIEKTGQKIEYTFIE